MHDFTELDEAIRLTLRESVRDLRDREDTLAMVACGMVEDLTGFFVAGAGFAWVNGLGGTIPQRSESAWSPSEWPLEARDSSDTSPGRVTQAIWELSGMQRLLDGTGGLLDGEAYDKLRHDYEERTILALRELRESGELRNSDGHEVWVWLHSADDSDSELDDRSFSRLQEPRLAAEFAERYGAGGAALFARLRDLGVPFLGPGVQ